MDVEKNPHDSLLLRDASSSSSLSKHQRGEGARRREEELGEESNHFRFHRPQYPTWTSGSSSTNENEKKPSKSREFDGFVRVSSSSAASSSSRPGFDFDDEKRPPQWMSNNSRSSGGWWCSAASASSSTGLLDLASSSSSTGGGRGGGDSAARFLRSTIDGIPHSRSFSNCRPSDPVERGISPSPTALFTFAMDSLNETIARIDHHHHTNARRSICGQELRRMLDYGSSPLPSDNSTMTQPTTMHLDRPRIDATFDRSPMNPRRQSKLKSVPKIDFTFNHHDSHHSRTNNKDRLSRSRTTTTDQSHHHHHRPLTPNTLPITRQNAITGGSPTDSMAPLTPQPLPPTTFSHTRPLRLSAAQKIALQNTWRLMKDNSAERISDRVFQKFLQSQPKAKDLFQKTAFLTIFSARSNSMAATYRDHSRLFVRLLSDLISNVDRCEKIFEQIRDCGMKHVFMRQSGFKGEIWERFGEAANEVISEQDCVKSNLEAVKAWTILIASITDEMRHGFEKEVRRRSYTAERPKSAFE